MCGRFALKAPTSKLAIHFKLDESIETAPRYNIAPGTDIATIRHSPEGKRVMHQLRWGLVPHWAKNPNIGNKLSNARGETVAVKPSFRDAFKRRRCLVPADGFYEWKAEGRIKQPYFFSMKDDEPFAIGGIWESWRTPEGDILRTCCLITTGPNETMQPVHDRMPVIVSPGDYEQWLTGEPDDALALVKPYASEEMQSWAVSRRVSQSGEEGPDLLNPVSVQND